MKTIIKDLSQPKIEAFSSQLRGSIVMPNDSNYDEECIVYNGMISKHPGMIVKCMDVADVIASINFSRESNLLVAVRGGGHNVGGLGLCDDGLAIDLSGIKFVRYYGDFGKEIVQKW